MSRVERAARPFDVERIPARRTAEASALLAHGLQRVAEVPGEPGEELQGRERKDELLALRAEIRRQLGDAPELLLEARVAIGHRTRRRDDAPRRRVHRPVVLTGQIELRQAVEVEIER